ncbi:hypothetical protein JAAARDRAFT_118172 [Jaapia argillacea MUCL 33604]|uniref:Pentacotripeptide-repeat region of PRORP domain-containing protein n=1 Tax=Jaapia argillacea MUCL 33604 TaxID=933084 RepID=A0A067QLX2_9AGAM|nr:hypothetical protein JAAARDRAFT_118172 [Jaapia argillacea MUCL 33604]
MRLLEPHVLSSRLKALCERGQVDQAVALLKSSPLDAQNPPVWNTLISECLKAKRYKLSYDLYTDMKRRGLKPTTRTYQTLFSGLSRIEHWPTHTKQLSNAHSLYSYYQAHVQAIKESDPYSPDLNVLPVASYLRLLGDAEEYQKMFDVYFAMDQDGPLAPNHIVYTAMLNALSWRRTGQTAEGMSIQAQNASDAKLLWRRMLKASEKKDGGFPIDSFVVAPMLRILARGRPTDQTLAFEIIRDFLGLSKPGETPLPPRFPLSPQTLEPVLELCNNQQKHRLCLHFAQQVIDRPLKNGEESIIDRSHMEQVLKAYAALSVMGATTESTEAYETLEWMLKQEVLGRNGPKIRPTASTYNLVLMACWPGGDWTHARKVFELMTGYRMHDFSDGADRSKEIKVDGRSKGRIIIPDAETMSCLVRTARVSRDKANMRQCLRIVGHLGADVLFGSSFVDGKKPKAVMTSKRLEKRATFYQAKLADGLVDLVKAVTERKGDKNAEGTSHPEWEEEVAAWRKLKKQAEDVLQYTAGLSKRTPELEERLLGSERELAHQGRLVEHDFATTRFT